jgi:hypothetical protein
VAGSIDASETAEADRIADITASPTGGELPRCSLALQGSDRLHDTTDRDAE